VGVSSSGGPGVWGASIRLMLRFGILDLRVYSLEIRNSGFRLWGQGLWVRSSRSRVKGLGNVDNDYKFRV